MVSECLVAWCPSGEWGRLQTKSSIVCVGVVASESHFECYSVTSNSLQWKPIIFVYFLFVCRRKSRPRNGFRRFRCEQRESCLVRAGTVNLQRYLLHFLIKDKETSSIFVGSFIVSIVGKLFNVSIVVVNVVILLFLWLFDGDLKFDFLCHCCKRISSTVVARFVTVPRGTGGYHALIPITILLQSVQYVLGIRVD